jgi:hypothetical protein
MSDSDKAPGDTTGDPADPVLRDDRPPTPEEERAYDEFVRGQAGRRKDQDDDEDDDDDDEDCEDGGRGQRKKIGFAKLKGQLGKKKGISNPGALAAWIGQKKYGKAGMAKKAAAGKAKAAK